MGFDNECIVNIQSLAGEYFCPVCRTLVYPNEALQSQCTHLYCKLCLTYVVRTTKACPYDGYLVTEKDSKPLVESDKALADRIGNTPVHCLFYKSGCLWLGPLSECNSHCAGCSFGNFLVVCNICGVQIIHRQVQEHAQSCPGEYYLHQQYYLPAQLVQLQSTYVGQQQSHLDAQQQSHLVTQLQTKVQHQSNPQSILQSQPQSHPYLHPLHPNNHPSQQPAPSVVPGNQPHPPVQSHQQTLQPPQQQNPIPIHPSGSSFPPDAQFPQQSPHVLSGPLHQSRYPSEYYQGVQRGQVNQNNPPSQPTFSNTFKAEPIGPLHGFYGVALLQNQRLHHSKDRYLNPHLSESFHQSVYNYCLPAFEAASGPHLKNVDDHKNHFMIGSGRIGQGEYEQAPKQFPKLLPTNIGNGSLSAGDYPHKCNYDNPSKFLPPYHPSGTSNGNNVGERPTDTQSDFPGSGPEFVVDHLPPRCPGREYYGIQSCGFAGLPAGPYNQPGHVDVHARGTYAVHEGSRTFDMSSDPTGKPLRDYLRSGDMTGLDFIPNHLRRVEFFGPRNVPSHFHAVDGFGTFPDPRMGEFTGCSGLPNTESFVGNKSYHLRLGEPGFRSNFSLHGFSSSGGFYAGNLDSFDRLRKRMPTSMGWCRICKVDCGSVDGLDLHSQTTEHQRRTMDMVISIKQQSAKRQKTFKDHSSVEERIRSRRW
ncbi:uncharacterized protein LOC141678690 [Apium graveolens]|uniref:uncharacterized protein LOC141678690 n=1 Tax=Apium graveolens TaxID=4045 RepID=UPI003D7BBD35